MKKAFIALVGAMVMGVLCMQAAPDLKDLLKKASEYRNNKEQSTSSSSAEGSTQWGSGKTSDLVSGIGSLVQGLVGGGKLDLKDLEGTWSYVKPAVSFRSNNFLQKAGGVAAANIIIGKIEPYFKKAGIDRSEVTFSADSTFTYKLGKLNLKGTIAPSAEEGASADAYVFTFTSKYGKRALGHVNASIKKSGKDLQITFDVSKLLGIASTVANATGQKSLQSIGSLLKSYEGLYLGSELQKSSTVPATE